MVQKIANERGFLQKPTSNHRPIKHLLGDFNAPVGSQEILFIKQRFNQNIENQNGELLVYFFTNNELKINNTFFQCRTPGDQISTNRSIHLQRS